MVNPVIADLAAQVEQTVGVEQSAIVAFQGFGQRLKDAVEQAVANGATEEQLAPVVDEVNLMRQSASALADAIAAIPGPAGKKKHA